MKALSLSTIQSAVGVLLFSCFSFVSVANAQQNAGVTLGGKSAIELCMEGGKSFDECNRITNPGYLTACADAAKAVNEAVQKRRESCSKSGLGAECVSRADECQTELMEEDVALPDLLGGMLGGMPGLANNCPTELGRDVKTDVDTLKKDLEAKRKEANDLQKEILEKEEKMKKDFADLNKEIAELDEAKSKGDADSEREYMDNKAQARNSLNEMKNGLQELNTQILKAESAKAEQLAKKAKDLAGLTDAMIKLNCESEVRKAVQQAGSAKTGSAGSLIRRYGQQKAAAQESFRQCYAAMIASRKEVVERYNGVLNQLDDEINKSNQRIQQIQTELKEMEAAAAQQEALYAKQKNDAEAKYQQDRQNLIQQMYNLQESYTKYQQTSQMQLAQLQQEINKLSNELAMLGQKPKSNTATVDEVMTAQSTYETALEAFHESYCTSGGTASGALKPNIGCESNHAGLCKLGKSGERARTRPGSGSTRGTDGG